MSTTDGFRADWATKDFYRSSASPRTRARPRSRRPTASSRAPTTPTPTPARHQAKHEKFKAVAEAYDVVGDAEKRAKYDEMRSLYGSGGGFPGGFGGGGGWRRRPAGFDLNDLLRDRGGGRRRSRRHVRRPLRRRRGPAAARPAQKGADVETTATIGFTDALDGVTVSLRLTSDSACPDLPGHGRQARHQARTSAPSARAPASSSPAMGGAFSINETCPACGGRQLVYDEACPTCHGTRARHCPRARSRPASRPGVKDGQQDPAPGQGRPRRERRPGRRPIRHGEGHAAPRSSVARATTSPSTCPSPSTRPRSAPRSRSRRWVARPVTLKVPAGTPNGRTFRVRGKGRTEARRHARRPARHRRGPGARPCSTPTAREAVEAYRAAMAGKPLRANLFEEA